MASWPGVLPLIAHAQAGMVMGGVMLSRGPCIPRWISALTLGTASDSRSNRSCGVPQSSPMTATRGPFAMFLSREICGVVWLHRPFHQNDPSIVPTGMQALRRVLHLQAAVWAVAGVALAVAPKFVLVTLFD